jgi:ureidoacrylate peracid hydrolase
MNDVTLAQVIRAPYAAGTAELQLTDQTLDSGNTALLLVDIQGLVRPEYLAQAAVEAGLAAGAVDAALADYRARFYAALDVCQKMLQTARACGVRPIHVRTRVLTADGRDLNPAYRALGWSYPSCGEAVAILPEVAPQPGEIVLDKSVGSAFTGTILDRLLRNMGVRYLFVCGFVTDECVETTLRDGLDHGYLAALVRDGAAAYTVEAHAHTVEKFGEFGLAPVSETVVAMFQRISV